MRRLTLFSTLLLLSLAVAVAYAERSPVAVPIPPDMPRYSLNAATGVASACRLGNPNDPAYYITGWFTGMEAYKFIFHPQQTNGCACPDGFWITNIHMLMYFPSPCVLSMWVDLEDANWDAQRNCWVPGPEDFTSPSYPVEIPSAGMYDISIPVTGVSDCAFMNYWYGISFHFWSFNCASPPALVVDSGPITPCTNWNDWGSGWQDLADYGFTWNLSMYADAECCQNPIKTEGSTWGSVKSLYR